MARLAAWLFPLAAALLPQAPPNRAPFKYFTELGDEVLNRVDAVMQGKVEAVTKVPGADVVRISIATWYLGVRRPDQVDVTIFAHEGDFFVGSEQLLFLKLYEGGPRYKLHNRVARADPDFDDKVRVLEQTVALRLLDKEEDRRRQVRKLLYDRAADRDAWMRWNAMHELKYVHAHHPDLVTHDDREQFTRLAARSEDEPFKKALLKLMKDWTP